MSLFRRRIVADTRPLVARRAGECAAIHARSFAYPWSAGEIENLMTERNVLADAAQDTKGGRLYGFILSRLAAEEAEILTVAIDPALRRRGIAKSLLGAHLGRLQSAGVKELFLEVDEQNEAARALYRRFGFETVGQRPAYYHARGGARTNAMVLRLAMG